ncbi:MAG: hypothetical protein ACOYXO_05885 [Chloroflexota bacterium]
MNEQMEWRVYRIEDKGDLLAALALYQKRFGTAPIRARVSERAPEELLFLLQEVPGLEIERAKTQLPRDVWLTHQRESQPQLSLFGEVEG